LNRYSGKDRPGKIHSPNGPLGSPWAYPPGIGESGIGLPETIAGLVVFLMLAMMGTQAFRGAAAARGVTAQVTAQVAAPTDAATALVRIGSVKYSPGGRE
jgi:hypothetical protein